MALFAQLKLSLDPCLAPLSVDNDLYRRMRHCAGDITLDASGRHAVVTSPRGGIVAALDVKRGRAIGEFSLSDTCTGAGTRTAGELVTASVRGLHFITAARQPEVSPLADADGRQFDTHLLML